MITSPLKIEEYKASNQKDYKLKIPNLKKTQNLICCPTHIKATRIINYF